MATVYLGRMTGAAGFERTVAIKRLHPHLAAADPTLISSFVDEARLAARIHHPNVVQTLDVFAKGRENFLVMEYVHGESMGGLVRACRRRGEAIPVSMGLSILFGILNGLHAAHEARDESGQPLDIVHRDISPQNILVGADGVARVLDFGVAKAARRLHETTQRGRLKGKIPYMAPEQIFGSATRQSDVYAAGVVLWEMLTGERLFKNSNEMLLFQAVLSANVPPPSAKNPNVPPEVDRIVQRAISRDMKQRYATAHEMAAAIDGCIDVASSMKVAQWVEATVGPVLLERRALVAEVERFHGAPPEKAEPAPASVDTTVRMTSADIEARMEPEGPERATVPMPTLSRTAAPPAAAPAAPATPEERATIPIPPPPATMPMPTLSRGVVPPAVSPVQAVPGPSPARLRGRALGFIAGALALVVLSMVAIEHRLANQLIQEPPRPPIETDAPAPPASSSELVSTTGPPTAEPSPSPSSTPSLTLSIADGDEPAGAERGEPPDANVAPPDASVAPKSAPRSAVPALSIADQARGVMLKDSAKARHLLEPRVRSGRGTNEEIFLLKTICRDQGDLPCVQHCKLLLGE
ncbi:protein kinase [Pendulispora albinea]|uniref:Protein kinase n=2 Tax=Pendulispora albinea TaxID=2741071 RepID=A0ABZ2LL28_9BACT